MMINNARCKHENKSTIFMAKASFNKKNFICKLSLNFRQKLVKCYMSRIAFYGVETWTIRKEDQKHEEKF